MRWSASSVYIYMIPRPNASPQLTSTHLIATGPVLTLNRLSNSANRIISICRPDALVFSFENFLPRKIRRLSLTRSRWHEITSAEELDESFLLLRENNEKDFSREVALSLRKLGTT